MLIAIATAMRLRVTVVKSRDRRTSMARRTTPTRSATRYAAWTGDTHGVVAPSGQTVSQSIAFARPPAGSRGGEAADAFDESVHERLRVRP